MGVLPNPSLVRLAALKGDSVAPERLRRSLPAPVNWRQVLQFVEKDGQALGQIFFLGNDPCGNFQPGGTEIPNAADARADHEIGGFLRYCGGNGEDAQPDAATSNKG